MSEFIRPDLIVLAREARGMTQAALAEKTALSPARLSRLEAGFQPVEPTDLAQVAAALDTPIEFFYQTDRVHAGGACFRYRKQKSLGVRFLRAVEAQTGVLSLRIGRLLRSVELESERSFRHLDLGDDGDFPSPEAAAQWLRQDWGLPAGPVSNMTQAIENAGGLIVVGDFQSPRIDALSHWSPPRPPVFFVNASLPADRYRWTLAHEVAHILLHHKPVEGDMEKQADAFASEFLMPATEIRPLLYGLTLSRIGGLKVQWKVSMASLIRRAHTLGVIDSDRYRYLNIEMSRNGWKKREPIDIPAEAPSLVKRMVEYHTTDLEYSVPDLAKLLLMNDADFDSFRKSVFEPKVGRPSLHLL